MKRNICVKNFPCPPLKIMPCSTQSPSLPLWFAYLISRNKMFALVECLVYFGNSVRLSTSTRWLLWWLILCVSLNGAKGCPEIVKCDFWVCFWGCFWKRLTLELVNRLRKIAITSDGGQHQLLMACIGQRQRKGDFALSAWVGTSISSCPQTLDACGS